MANLIAILLAALLVLAPGLAASFALLKGVSLSRWAKGLVGVFLGATLAPALGVVEESLGLSYTFGLALLNALLVLALSLAALYLQGVRPERARSEAKALRERLSKLGDLTARGLLRRDVLVGLALLLVTLVGVYARMNTAWNANFFEFDPYYYDRVTETLVRTGTLPAQTDTVYYPIGQNLRGFPIVHFMTGSWYLFYQNLAGLAYDKTELILTAQLYPPLFAALASLFLFLLLREHYDDVTGVLGAALFAFTPQLIKKMAGAVNELAPFGIGIAVILFALYGLALQRRSLRLGALAGFAWGAAILGSAQYLWPHVTLALVMALVPVLEFARANLDLRFVKLHALVALGALAAALLMQWKWTSIPTSAFLLLGASFAPTLYFWLAPRARQRKRYAYAAFLLLALAFTFLTPFGQGALNAVLSQVAFARQGAPILLTVQEENPTSPSFWPGAYGALTPPLVLSATAVVLAAGAALDLYRRKWHLPAGLVVLAVAAGLFVSKPLLDAGASLLTSLGLGSFASVLQASQGQEVFVFFLLSLASAAYLYWTDPARNRLTPLLLLVIYPVAFVGLNKLKFMLHLAVSLVVAAPLLAGEFSRLVQQAGAWLKLGDEKDLRNTALALVLLFTLAVSAAQANTLGQSMTELSWSRLSGDWLHATDWMRANLAGTDARIISWWDYGHWITFFGETKSVLDPGNQYSQFNHETAHAFVDGNVTDLYRTMEYHGASHVLVDAQLIPKWGALVYLSSTCSVEHTPETRTCPPTPDNPDWMRGPGNSRYEAEHYFETLQYTGQNCPPNVAPVPMPLLQSSFGFSYCATDNELFLVTRAGLDESLKRRYTVVQDLSNVTLDANVSYLFPIGQNAFLNANPFLGNGQKSEVFKSAFARLYLFERLPGYELAYRSPNNEVKVFKFTGRAPREEILAQALDA
jgi:asparagine N-glycosylation enzyme membrane subunit Stt3